LAYYAAVLVGRITGLARPSACLSVCPARTPLLKTERRSKPPNVGVNVPHGRSNGCVDFIARSRVIIGRQKRPPDSDAYLTYVFDYGRRITRAGDLATVPGTSTKAKKVGGGQHNAVLYIDVWSA